MECDPLALDAYSERICHRFRNCLGTHDVLGLHGPPGSGKTRLEARITRDCCVEGLKVADITYTNAEVKDIFWRTYRGLSWAGFSDERIRSMMMAYGTTDKLLSPPNPVPMENINRPWNDKTLVVISTEYSTKIHSFSADLVNMDERSTRALQHAGMSLVKLNLENLSLTNIIGDHHQNIDFESERSVLEDLNTVSKLWRLPYTRRMPKPIHYPSAKVWYDPPYKPHPSIARRKPVPAIEPTGKWELLGRPEEKLVLIHCEGKPIAEITQTMTGPKRSYKDPVKGRLADEIARELVNSYPGYDVAVLAPYRAHTFNVQEVISGGTYKTSTVHSYLGRETDFSISVIPKAGRGTLYESKDNVLNVQITRSRFKQILVCDIYELMDSSTNCYTALLNFIEHGLVLDEKGGEVDLGL